MEYSLDGHLVGVNEMFQERERKNARKKFIARFRLLPSKAEARERQPWK
jgi:hypothetical protein